MRNITQFKGLSKFLSNFHSSPIRYRKEIYLTAEHLFQALKTRDLRTREVIRQAGTPGQAKILGRKVSIREDWEEVKNRMMSLIIKMKFLQNPKLRKRLLDTGKRILVEGNHWHDNYWGNCLCPKCRRIEGRNQLGKILMRVRELLREENG